MTVLDQNGECLCLIYSYELVLGGVVVIVACHWTQCERVHTRPRAVDF